MEIFILFFWVLLSIVLTFIGAKRKIGGPETLLICFLLSPLIGLLFVAFSKRKDVETFENALLENQSTIITLLKELGKEKVNYDEL